SARHGRTDAEGLAGGGESVRDRRLSEYAARLPCRLSGELSKRAGGRRVETVAGLVQAARRGVAGRTTSVGRFEFPHRIMLGRPRPMESTPSNTKKVVRHQGRHCLMIAESTISPQYMHCRTRTQRCTSPSCRAMT